MAFSNPHLSRRGLVALGCAGVAVLTSGSAGAQSTTREPLDVGGARNGSLSFDPIATSTEAAQKPKPAPLPPDQRVGCAIAGIGRLAGEEVIPAFA